MGGHYKKLLDNIVADPGKKVETLEMLSSGWSATSYSKKFGSAEVDYPPALRRLYPCLKSRCGLDAGGGGVNVRRPAVDTIGSWMSGRIS